ncbi:MAG: 50S ribosomal protein L32e [Candidatus Aenigmarchaeota archaeon]|nr:50S ribosomal protein L32e [Candidatus Aenigmarchaeota archaeon]
MNKELLELRSKIKKKKPKFKRQEHKRKGLKDVYRRPRGIRSKIRMRLKGKSRLPSPGYGSPSEVKGLNRNGLREVIVFNRKDLEKVNPDSDIAVISGTVGMKKRIEILELAQKSNIKVQNK